VFSPLDQGLLTDKYLGGIPAGSRAAREDTFLDASDLTEGKLKKIRRLNDIAQERNQSLAQMALAWVLRQQEVTSALIGTTNVSQIDEAVGSLQNLSFTNEELTTIEQTLSDR
jgi:L-glyceraldehyde 3-phosphate reductase